MSLEYVIVRDEHSYPHFGSLALYFLKPEINEQGFFGATSVIGNYLKMFGIFFYTYKHDCGIINIFTLF